ncbi:threonine/homoserine/homoserine lactone efflux protein [Rhodoferax ferrireducens]|uniref:Threonine/homoserine/homoserine lactone efflux protein n=1 Tax=Rhodoferax ferrireducens TaxID=192843 RepID=A0ABU2CE16_9BURK|nr:LysE family translocator [Rhodoferax ferrireducens]MDR7379582.1 threonine/homoserine/homoserine lactone efflux protein [Rhodoferax ferrireducens]
MSTQLFFALTLFAFVSSVTPGPNNLMLLASGVNHGFRATLPHMVGISVGVFILLTSVGMGLGLLLEQIPQLYLVLKWLGAAYLLYLAWGVATAGAPKDAEAKRPISFWGAAGFQWVNPKAWVMAVGAFSSYLPAHSGSALVLGTAILFAVVNLPTISLWALFGSRLRHWLRIPHYRRIFNGLMAVLLVASLAPMLS